MNKQLQRLAIFFLIVFSLSVFSSAQEKRAPAKIINGGIINGKAVTLVKPEYPAAARAVNAEGAVNIRVTIDENGDVYEATATSGHPLLRDVAVKAARESKFSPTLLLGAPVKVTGIIVYNFYIPKAEANNEEALKPLGLGMFLYMVRSLDPKSPDFDSDPEFESILKDTPPEFPKLEKELEPLKSLKSVAQDRRGEVLDKVISDVKSKLIGSDAWQFEVGKNFGELLGQFRNLENQPNIEKLDMETIKLNLQKINDLIFSAPQDVPSNVMSKLKDFAALSENQKLSTEEGLKAIFSKLQEIFEAISPSLTK